MAPAAVASAAGRGAASGGAVARSSNGRGGRDSSIVDGLSGPLDGLSGLIDGLSFFFYLFD